ncbi:VOC family protein [Enterococcus hulanensis]|uniref:VOC family protein n=1 Tax=Enterococcus hulanensis TaxID=2559929 RepID=A0ABU3F3V7_9ENTE|nr:MULTISPECIES: VOC family protein [Enterococcus]MBO0412894.1 VOC family protein [Enterococcus hulanensis]MBO0458786.1 VOC family protein [Enterococcus hulanensis]MDT2601810.1 VOC family protein [Enterococcus hulanensis]MDT2611195.1 VOC family protein [Enterococcus hulanensis]MDT2618519.1 VOC family protein [Enterococcus hulanensis]
MKFKGPMLVVKDIERAKRFYTEVIGVRVIADFGENATLTGGLALQTESSWSTFTDCTSDFFSYHGNDAEMYFEEEDFDGFLEKIAALEVERVGEDLEMPWGQKVIRLYDPDKHIVEIGEDMKVMMKRLHATGLSIQQLSEKTFMSPKMVERMLK